MRLSKTGGLAALAAAAAVTVLAGPLAQAVPAPNGYLDSLTFVGSDTIQDVDSALAAQFNSESGNTDPDRAVNVPAQSATASTAPGDRFCAPRTYATSPQSGQVQAPNGSGAGKTALNTSASTTGDGCTDVARSSSGRGGTDPASFQYYAFARDAVGVASSSSSPAPQDLTLDQVCGIYNCTFTNWSQVGGGSGAITRYLPQAGSGTRSFFIASVLGGVDPNANTSCGAVKTFQENDATSIQAGDAATAILPYSAAQFVAQANGATLPDGTVVTDNRNGFTIRSIGGLNPITTVNGVITPNTTVYNDPTYVGGRNVYHVIDTRSPSYNDALRMVGFDGTGPSRLCSGAYAATLSRFGFAPLPRTSAVNGTFCRLS